MHSLLDPHTLRLMQATVDRYHGRYATGEFTHESKKDNQHTALDLGIRDTLYKGQFVSESNMSRGEVLGHLDMMMNTKSYREDFQKNDPDRFNIYNLAYNEFVAQKYHDTYPSPVKEEEPAQAVKE